MSSNKTSTKSSITMSSSGEGGTPDTPETEHPLFHEKPTRARKTESPKLFTFPKYRKHTMVRTPEGVGKITCIDLTNYGYFYTVGCKVWAEGEVKEC